MTAATAAALCQRSAAITDHHHVEKILNLQSNDSPLATGFCSLPSLSIYISLSFTHTHAHTAQSQRLPMEAGASPLLTLSTVRDLYPSLTRHPTSPAPAGRQLPSRVVGGDATVSRPSLASARSAIHAPTFSPLHDRILQLKVSNDRFLPTT